MSKGQPQPAVIRQIGTQTLTPNPVYQRNAAQAAMIRQPGPQTVAPGAVRR